MMLPATVASVEPHGFLYDLLDALWSTQRSNFGDSLELSKSDAFSWGFLGQLLIHNDRTSMEGIPGEGSDG